ncbi:hypothetical protein CEXT_416661 [Caerostris extrusa]|uniref:Uncharacterized protein n=1 Tax=Caerostris extrusa TaxID=172846 RepID=A0AAV4N6L5_CAEEX|nr:hypothetical protein CEXT_416661 [Caerostris extrusa]
MPLLKDAEFSPGQSVRTKGQKPLPALPETHTSECKLLRYHLSLSSKTVAVQAHECFPLGTVNVFCQIGSQEGFLSSDDGLL